MNDNKINEDNLRKLIYLRERELGINNSNISSCCNGNKKSAGGFKWKHYQMPEN